MPREVITELHNRCAQLKAALDRRDYDTAYSLAGDVSTLVQLAADAAERVVGERRETRDAA